MRVAADRHRVLLEDEVVAGRAARPRPARRATPDPRCAGSPSRDLVVVGDVEREVDERPHAREVVVERPRRAGPHRLGDVRAEQAPRAAGTRCPRPRRACAGRGRRRASRGAARPASAGTRGSASPRSVNERRNASTSSRSAARQLAHLVRLDDRRVQRVDREPQRVREDRVEEEEHRDSAAAGRSRCATTRIVSFPTSGTSTSGRSSSKSRSSARKWRTVRRIAHASDLPALTRSAQ